MIDIKNIIIVGYAVIMIVMVAVYIIEWRAIDNGKYDDIDDSRDVSDRHTVLWRVSKTLAQRQKALIKYDKRRARYYNGRPQNR